MRCSLLVLTAGLCALAMGCAPDTPEAGKVTGKLTRDGEPISGARVSFCDASMTDASMGYGAYTDAAGQYEIPKLKPGDYKVAVYKLVPKPGARLPEPPDLEQIEASGQGVHALPKKYSRLSSSPLKASIKPGKNEVDLAVEGK